LPNEARPVTGIVVSLGSSRNDSAIADQLAIAGTQGTPGRLILSNAPPNHPAMAGKTAIAPKTWHQLALVRDAHRMAVYLDGNPEPEINGPAGGHADNGPGWLSIGGRGNADSFEGKIDEVALYDRSLSADEIAAHVRAVNAR
jgi:hypothetical protein